MLASLAKSGLWWESKRMIRTVKGNWFKDVMTPTTSASHSWVHNCGLWSVPHCPFGSCQSPCHYPDSGSSGHCGKSTAPSYDSWNMLGEKGWKIKRDALIHFHVHSFLDEVCAPKEMCYVPRQTHLNSCSLTTSPRYSMINCPARRGSLVRMPQPLPSARNRSRHWTHSCLWMRWLSHWSTHGQVLGEHSAKLILENKQLKKCKWSRGCYSLDLTPCALFFVTTQTFKQNFYNISRQTCE